MGRSLLDDTGKDDKGRILILYSRPDCHLCDVAKPVVLDVARRHGVTVEERNVEDDPQWEAAFGTQIPVAFLGEWKLFKYRVDGAALERRLTARLAPEQDCV